MTALNFRPQTRYGAPPYITISVYHTKTKYEYDTKTTYEYGTRRRSTHGQETQELPTQSLARTKHTKQAHSHNIAEHTHKHAINLHTERRTITSALDHVAPHLHPLSPRQLLLSHHGPRQAALHRLPLSFAHQTVRMLTHARISCIV